MEKLTINLTNPVVQAIARAQGITEENKTDAIHHAILLYAIVCEAIDKGGAVYIRPEAGGELERIVLL